MDVASLQKALDGAAVMLETWPEGVPLPEISIYCVVRDANGMVYVHNDEDLKHIPLKEWLEDLTEEDRQYLINKHGEHNKPIGA